MTDPTSAYSGIEAELYDLWFSAESFEDSHFFQKMIARRAGPALEVGCGTGRLLLRYLRDGLDVDGVDNSADMLAICRRKAAALDLRPVLYQQAMEHLALPRTYQTIYVPYNSFMLVTDRAAAESALLRFKEHLATGGQLIITLSFRWGDTNLLLNGNDTGSPNRTWRLRRHVNRRPGDGAMIMLHEAGSADVVEQLYEVWHKYEIYRDATLTETHMRMFRLRWYTKHEFLLMLERVGFSGATAVSDYAGSTFTGVDPTMVFHVQNE